MKREGRRGKDIREDREREASFKESILGFSGLFFFPQFGMELLFLYL